MLSKLFSDKWLDAIMRAEEAEKEAEKAKKEAEEAIEKAKAVTKDWEKIAVQNLLRNGVSVEIIADASGFTETEVLDMKGTL
jgi:SOS response regulatory protein OraA/RecX